MSGATIKCPCLCRDPTRTTNARGELKALHTRRFGEPPLCSVRACGEAEQQGAIFPMPAPQQEPSVVDKWMERWTDGHRVKNTEGRSHPHFPVSGEAGCSSDLRHERPGLPSLTHNFTSGKIPSQVPVATSGTVPGCENRGEGQGGQGGAGRTPGLCLPSTGGTAASHTCPGRGKGTGAPVRIRNWTQGSWTCREGLGPARRGHAEWPQHCLCLQRETRERLGSSTQPHPKEDGTA